MQNKLTILTYLLISWSICQVVVKKKSTTPKKKVVEPIICPPLITPACVANAVLKDSFKRFVADVATNADQSLDVCVPESFMDPKQSKLQPQMNSMQASIPMGSQIILVSTEIISGFYFQKIIYYYSGAYYYVMYATGIRAFRLLQTGTGYLPFGTASGMSIAQILKKVNEMITKVKKAIKNLNNVVIQEGMIASSLKQIKACVPKASTFMDLKCRVTITNFCTIFGMPES